MLQEWKYFCILQQNLSNIRNMAEQQNTKLHIFVQVSPIIETQLGRDKNMNEKQKYYLICSTGKWNKENYFSQVFIVMPLNSFKDFCNFLS